MGTQLEAQGGANLWGECIGLTRTQVRSKCRLGVGNAGEEVALKAGAITANLSIMVLNILTDLCPNFSQALGSLVRLLATNDNAFNGFPKKLGAKMIGSCHSHQMLPSSYQTHRA